MLTQRLKPLYIKFLNKFLVPYLPKQQVQHDNLSKLIQKSARFVACEMVEGDYLEFGVYQGASFISAYHALKTQYEDRINLKIGGESEEKQQQLRQKLWTEMRFFAFDSFQGLPQLAPEDKGTEDFTAGQYAYPLEKFRESIENAGVPPDRIITVKGWFKDTCVNETAKQYNLTKASIVWLDADLYSSTKSALDFIIPMLQDGTILIFDDWYSFKGNPSKGVQKAFYEWIKNDYLRENFIFHEYHKESWKRTSFIASKISD
jgi:hypothetical protein